MSGNQEQTILTVSACGALFFALLAFVWGVLARSQMIMFDGVYSFISLLLTGLYIFASMSIAKGRTETFPFGKAQLEPMVVAVQSMVLLLICGKALSSAILALFSGGQGTNALSGMAYAAIGVLGCWATWLYISRTSIRNASASELVKTLSSQWLIDTLLSLAVLVGFFIGFVIQRAGYGQYAWYVDPLMVIVAVLFFVREPIVSFIQAIMGLLLASPEKSSREALTQTLDKIAKQRGFKESVLRLGKCGREIVCEVDFVSETPERACTIKEMQDIRGEIERRLGSLFGGSMWLAVSFVPDEKQGGP